MASDHFSLLTFDEFRSDHQEALAKLDSIIKDLKLKDDEGDTLAKASLYLCQGLTSIIDAEQKFHSNDYTSASNAYNEGIKSLNRFQRMNTSFASEIQLEADRLDFFAKGRNLECQALKKGTTIEEEVTNFTAAINFYIKETQITKKINKLLLIYNVKARTNYLQGLIKKIEGQQAVQNKNLRLAKKKHLEAFRYFIYARYYNPFYSQNVEEENNAIKTTLNSLIKDRASKEWNAAYTLSNQGKFIESCEKCRITSKLFMRASKLATEQKDAMLLEAHSYMLKASMYEASANELLKNKNDAKGSIRQFQLAAEAMKEATQVFPKRDGDLNLLKRWEIQMKYYSTNVYQSQGISNLDGEKYTEALELFNQANEQFQQVLKEAETIKDSNLIKLIQKSIAEAKGYIGMCKTVLV